jgi:hypothetical protein
MQTYNKRLAEQRQRQNGINWRIKKKVNKTSNATYCTFECKQCRTTDLPNNGKNQNGVANNERHLQVAEQRACRTTATPKKENTTAKRKGNAWICIIIAK